MKAVGVILAGGVPCELNELSKNHAAGVLPVAGTFRCIDFSLNSLVNSGLTHVAVAAQFHARSVRDYLSSSKWWDFGRKKGGLYVFSPMATSDQEQMYQGTADALIQNLDFLRDSHEPYVVVTSGDTVFHVDLNPVLDYHIENQADITIVCAECREHQRPERLGVVELDEDGRILQFHQKPEHPSTRLVSTGIYLMKRRFLVELLEEAAQNGAKDLVRDVLLCCFTSKRFYGYRLQSYWSNIASLSSYYYTNLDFLKPEIRRAFFQDGPRLRTRGLELPPVKYLSGAVVKNSLVSGGSILAGRVENSVIAEDVFIGENSVVKNSVILGHVYIGENAHIEDCIVDSHATVHANACFYRTAGKISIVTSEKRVRKRQV